MKQIIVKESAKAIQDYVRKNRNQFSTDQHKSFKTNVLHNEMVKFYGFRNYNDFCAKHKDYIIEREFDVTSGTPFSKLNNKSQLSYLDRLELSYLSLELLLNWNSPLNILQKPAIGFIFKRLSECLDFLTKQHSSNSELSVAARLLKNHEHTKQYSPNFLNTKSLLLGSSVKVMDSIFSSEPKDIFTLLRKREFVEFLLFEVQAKLKANNEELKCKLDSVLPLIQGTTIDLNLDSKEV